MEDKDYYILDQESIDHILASRKEVKKICKTHNVCATCPIGKFEAIYGLKPNECNSVHIVEYLLGSNDYAAEFYKTQYNEFRDMCLGRECDTCIIKKTKDKYYKELGYVECSELYIAVKLLKDI